MNVRKFLRSEGFKGQKVLKVRKVRIKVSKVRRFSRSESFEGRKVMGVGWFVQRRAFCCSATFAWSCVY